MFNMYETPCTSFILSRELIYKFISYGYDDYQNTKNDN